MAYASRQCALRVLTDYGIAYAEGSGRRQLRHQRRICAGSGSISAKGHEETYALQHDRAIRLIPEPVSSAGPPGQRDKDYGCRAPRLSVRQKRQQWGTLNPNTRRPFTDMPRTFADRAGRVAATRILPLGAKRG